MAQASYALHPGDRAACSSVARCSVEMIYLTLARTAAFRAVQVMGNATNGT